MNLTELQKILDDQSHPPVHLWEPDYCAEMDLVIKSDGSWHYMGSPISRKKLVKLFSTVLRLDADSHYYLVTPVEKLRIRVEDAPFTAVEVDQVTGDGDDRLVFRTNVDELVVAGPDHRVRVIVDPDDGTPRPYVHVRAGLDALISRAVFYQLVDMASHTTGDDDVVRLSIDSAGETFILGEA